MKRSLILVFAILAVLAPGARGAGDGIEIQVEDLGVVAPESEKIMRRGARNVLSEARKAFATVANLLGTSSRWLFALENDPPRWVPWRERAEPRIWIQLEEEPKREDPGGEAYLRRMERGEFRIFLPAPAAEDLSPDDVHRIWRDVTRAVLCHWNWQSAPLWLREGLAEFFGARAAEGASAAVAAFREELAALAAAEGGLPVLGTLAATDPAVFEAGGGRAVAFGLVTLLMEADERIAVGLLNQSRGLMEHLVAWPDAGAVREEFTESLLEQLSELRVSGDLLLRALAAYVTEGFPEGPDLRRSDAKKLLRKRKLPDPFGVGLSGRFGSMNHYVDVDEIEHWEQEFAGGSLAWRLPWPATLKFYVGVRGRPGTSYGLRPEKSHDGYFLGYRPFGVRSEGRQTFESIVLDLPRQTTKDGFLWCAVLSPRKLGYVWRQEMKLK